MSSDIPSTPGIYRITCTVTGKFYIGSAVNLQNRWRVHRHYLFHNTHNNPKLQRAWNKYGPDTFTFEVLEYVLLPELLTAREQYWFNKLRPFDDRGFNIDRVAGSRLGQEVSLSTREKLKLANLGKKQSEELIHRRTAGQKGKKRGSQFSGTMRAATLRHPVSGEAREHMKMAKLGTKQSETTRKKRSISLLGREESEVTRAKKSASQTWRMQTLIVTSPEGVEQTIVGINKFCKEHSLSYSNLLNVAKGRAHQTKGWKARFP